MSNATLRSSSASVPAEIAERLRALRRSLALWLTLAGASRVLALALALALVDLACDWYFRMDWSQRALSLVLIVSALTWVVYRQLFLPLSRRVDDDALCLRVERRRRELGERLIGAVQFSRMANADAQGVSQKLIVATIVDGTAAASQIDFTDVLDRKTLGRNLALTVVAAVGLLVMGASVVVAEPMAIWFNRNVLLGDRHWPQNTYLIIKGAERGSLAIPRGDDWDQVVEVQGVVPEMVELDYRPHGWSSRVTEQIVQQGDRQFHTLFKNVLEEFDFRVRGGDDQSAWITVRLVERPAVAELELRLIPPTYVTTGPETLEPGKGPYFALPGSSLEVSGRATKPLADASVGLGDQRGGKARLSPPDRFQTSIDAAELAPGVYAIHLVDTDGLSSQRPTRFTIKRKLDRDPVVKVKLSGVSGLIVPGASIPMSGSVSDDHAVTAAWIAHAWRAEATDPASAPAVVEGRLPLDDLKEQGEGAKRTYQITFETKPLDLPIGATLVLHAEATDNDSVSGPKLGKSDQISLKVVSEEELRADLLRREREQGVELERLLKEQEESTTDTRAILAAVHDKPETPDDQRQLLMKTQKRQNLASGRCGSIAAQFVQILAEVESNHLDQDQGELQRRLREQIIVPLQSLANDSVPRAAGLLDSARRAADAAGRDKALAEAADAEDRIAAEMRTILKFMAKAESYQEAVNLLYAILKAQTELNGVTVQEAQRRLDELFGPQSKKESQPPASAPQGEKEKR